MVLYRLTKMGSLTGPAIVRTIRELAAGRYCPTLAELAHSTLPERTPVDLPAEVVKTLQEQFGVIYSPVDADEVEAEAARAHRDALREYCEKQDNCDDCPLGVDFFNDGVNCPPCGHADLPSEKTI